MSKPQASFHQGQRDLADIAAWAFLDVHPEQIALPARALYVNALAWLRANERRTRRQPKLAALWAAQRQALVAQGVIVMAAAKREFRTPGRVK